MCGEGGLRIIIIIIIIFFKKKEIQRNKYTFHFRLKNLVPPKRITFDEFGRQ
jgi:hypothetical protein